MLSSLPNRLMLTVNHAPGALGRLWGARCATPLQFAAPLWCGIAMLTVLGVSFLRLAYLIWFCPFDLAPDEAHYWDWSRRLDWCYYSKGPLVAWLIHAAEASCGSWLRDGHGTTMPAVRLPAVVCGALLALGIFTLAWQVTDSPRLAFAAMLAVLLTPHFTVASTLITIDPPFLCLWQWSLVAAFHALGLNAAQPTNSKPLLALSRRQVFSWLVLGVLIGFGILAKPTMVLFPACLTLYLALNRSARAHLRCAPFWLMLGLAFLVGAGPILVWNAQHDWVTFRHVFTQATLTTSARWRPWGGLEYFGVQTAVLLGGGMFVWIMASFWAIRLRSCSGAVLSPSLAMFLACFSWPVFALFALFSFRTGIQPNWPVAAYLAAIPLVTLWLNHTGQAAGVTRIVRRAFWSSAPLAMLATVFLHHPQPAYDLGLLPALVRLTHQADSPFWPRRFDPTCRLLGWRELAQSVQQLRLWCRQQGYEPVLAATPYGTAAELAFYLPDQPLVFCLSRANGLRFSQYDLWRPNPTTDPELFAGSVFICVGPMTHRAQAGFAAIQPPITITVHRYGFAVAQEYIYLAYDFRGFPPDERPPRY